MHIMHRTGATLRRLKRRWNHSIPSHELFSSALSQSSGNHMRQLGFSSSITLTSPPSLGARVSNVDSAHAGTFLIRLSGEAKKAKGQSPRNAFREIVLVLERVQDLCNESKYPIGSLIPKQNYSKAKALFHTIITKANSLVQEKYSLKINRNKGGSRNPTFDRLTSSPLEKDESTNMIADIINAALQLLVRICREPWIGPKSILNMESGITQQSPARFCKPKYTNLLFVTWKNAALQNEKVVSAIEVTQLLLQISSKNCLRYDCATIGMVLQVAVHQSPSKIAPAIVQHIWDTLEQPGLLSMTAPSDHSTKLVLYFYNALLKAHAECGSNADEVEQNMYDVLYDMRNQRNVQPDVISYNILLRFLRQNCLHLEKFESAFQRMQLENIQPDLATLSEAVYCYAKFEQLSLAEQYLHQMLDALTDPSKNEDPSACQKYYSDVALVAQAAQNVMNLYRTLFRKCKSSSSRQDMIDRAYALFLTLDKQNITSGSSPQPLLWIMMDLYTRSGNPEATKALLKKVRNPSESLYGLMIQAYGEADNIDHAMDVFYTMLEDPRVTPNIKTFNVLLNACAVSTIADPDVADRATIILKLLEKNHRCRSLKLKPDAVTYHTYLKCLTKSFQESAYVQAEGVLDEMERRAKTDNSFQLDKVTYNLAIRVALRANDRDRIDSLLLRMQKSSVPADTRLCNTILNHYAQIGSSESAQRAESFLIDLIEMGKKDLSIRPNVFTYNMALNAWARSKDPVSGHRMWIIYLNMMSQNVALDEVTYNTLISHFSKSQNCLCRADKLLQTLESDIDYSDSSIRPDFTLYTHVVKGYIKFNDVENATRVLFRFIDAYAKGYLKGGPNASIYHLIAQSWIKVGDIERASTIIEKIHESFTEQKLPEPPNAMTYRLLYDAWKDSHHPAQDVYLTKIKTIIDLQQPQGQLTA